MCPRTGSEQIATAELDLDAQAVFDALAAMDLPDASAFETVSREWLARHPGGVGEILFDPDGGSWLKGELLEDQDRAAVQVVALA